MPEYAKVEELEWWQGLTIRNVARNREIRPWCKCRLRTHKWSAERRADSSPV